MNVITNNKWIGQRTIRPDGVDKVTGRAAFAADTTMPGMIWGKVKRSPHPHARIKSIDTSAAKRMPGVHCVVTADDIRNHAASREITIWAYNDFCPPSPGCAFPQDPPPPSSSGIGYAAVWQFAQSPRRKEFTAHCPASYHKDGNCYAPGDIAHAWFLDVNSAASPDPSGGVR